MNCDPFLYAEKVQSTKNQWVFGIPDFTISNPAMLDAISISQYIGTGYPKQPFFN